MIEAARPVEISVVVPSRNRRAMLARCLGALAAQSLDPAAFEVVVVDDGSSDGTDELLAGLDTPYRMRSLRLHGGGQSAARNAGAEAASGAVCLFLDDDCIASAELVEEHLAAHREDPRLLAIGKLVQQIPNGGDWYARAFARDWREHYERMETRPASWSDCYSGNISVPRRAMLDLGGFATDVPVSEDIELGFRLQERGFALRYLPRASAVHDDQKPRRRLLEDVRKHGQAYLALSERHPGMAEKLLGWFGQAGSREVAMRRALIALRISPALAASAGRALPGEARKEHWYRVVWRFAFWREVRRRTSAPQWKRLAR